MPLKSVAQQSPADSPANGNGWIFLQDSYYTAARPLSIPQGVKMNIPDDAEGVLTSRTYAPQSAANWYNPETSTFHCDALGDFFFYRLNFTCEASVNNRSVTVTFDIGTPNAPFETTIVLARGAGTPVKQSVTIPIACTSGFLNNGATIKISADCDLKVYKISITVLKAFKGPQA